MEWLGPFAFCDHSCIHFGRAKSNPINLCVECVYVRRRGVEPSWEGVSASWGHLSAAGRCRRRLASFYPWPMFSINPNDALRTLGFILEKVFLSLLNCLFFLSHWEEIVLGPPCKCTAASRGNESGEVKQKKGENTNITNKDYTMGGASQAICSVR